MKPILLLFFLFLEGGYGAVWPLPQEADAALHHLRRSITDARKTVVIISLEIEGYTLKEALRKAAAKGTRIELIVARPWSISSLALFSTVSLYTAPTTIPNTIIQIDANTTCTLSAPLSENTIATMTGVLTCNPTIENRFPDGRLLYSRPYLEE